jgi:hypothetical protein
MRWRYVLQKTSAMDVASFFSLDGHASLSGLPNTGRLASNESVAKLRLLNTCNVLPVASNA